jgi:hypothetical protein
VQRPAVVDSDDGVHDVDRNLAAMGVLNATPVPVAAGAIPSSGDAAKTTDPVSTGGDAGVRSVGT